MSNLKCPFCQQELVREGSDNYWCKKCNLERYNPALYGSQKLWQELIRIRKELEQSETCCTEWEKQVLDYKAENIALSGDLERTRKALELAITGLKNCKTRDHIGAVCRTPEYVDKVLEQITALEQKD